VYLGKIVSAKEKLIPTKEKLIPAKEKKRRKKLFWIFVLVILLIALTVFSQSDYFKQISETGFFGLTTASGNNSLAPNSDLDYSNLVCANYFSGDKLSDVFARTGLSSTNTLTNSLDTAIKPSTDTETTSTNTSSSENANSGNNGNSNGTSNGNGNSGNNGNGNGNGNENNGDFLGQICFTDSGEPIVYITKNNEEIYLTFVTDAGQTVVVSNPNGKDDDKIIMKILD